MKQKKAIKKAILNADEVATVAAVAEFFSKHPQSGRGHQIAKDMLREGLRKIADLRGNGRKHCGHPNWSKKAAKSWKDNNGPKGLRHEHVVPVEVLANILLDFKGKPEDYAAKIEALTLVAIITEDEDGNLKKKDLENHDWTKDPWVRYPEDLRSQIGPQNQPTTPKKSPAPPRRKP